jgi:hypothetical protein
MNATARRRPQMFVFCHHKVGTVLFANVLFKLARHFGMVGITQLGRITEIDRSIDIVIFAHSILDLDLDAYDYRGVHIVRDPRDVWVSSYLYHRRCPEPWCTNTDTDPSPPIVFPRVPASQEHRPEAWKRAYLAALGARSYQQNLNALPRADGLRFELERYTSWTLEAMANWVPRPGRILEMPLEDFAGNYDVTMTRALVHLGFPQAVLPTALAIAATEDVGRMSNQDLAANPHIYSRKLSKWPDFLDAVQVREFEARYGDLIARLGYRRASDPALHAGAGTQRAG